MAANTRGAIAPRVFLTGMLGALAVAVVIVLVMVLLGEYTKTRGQMLLTSLVLAGFCLSALPPSALHQRRRYPPLGEAGLMASAAGFVLVATGIWATPNPDAYWKAAAIGSILAAAMFHASLLLLLPPGRAPAPWVLWASVTATSLTALLSSLGIIFEAGIAGFWWAVVFMIVTALVGGLVASGLSRWGGKRGPAKKVMGQ